MEDWVTDAVGGEENGGVAPLKAGLKYEYHAKQRGGNDGYLSDYL